MPGGGGGVAHTRARTTAAATIGGGCRRRDSLSLSSSVVSGQWSVCVRSRRARDARVMHMWRVGGVLMRRARYNMTMRSAGGGRRAAAAWGWAAGRRGRGAVAAAAAAAASRGLDGWPAAGGGGCGLWFVDFF